jgi:hypothetical protein
MPRIKTNDLLERIRKGDFLAVRLNGLQGGSFCMLLECVECDDRAGNRLLGRGSDHVNLARHFKALSLPKLLRQVDVRIFSPRMRAAE